MTALALQQPQAAPDLPPGWQPDASLRPSLPEAVDTTAMRRLAEAPTRYAVDILTGTVWSLTASRPIAAQPGKQNRARVRLFLGANGGSQWHYVARLVAAAAYGPAPTSDHEAHHLDGDTANNDWRNLRWVTPHTNRTIAQKQQRKRASAQPKISAETLRKLVRAYDLSRAGGWYVDPFTNDHRPPTATPYGCTRLAQLTGLTRQQVWRIVNEQSRAAEVRQIRAELQQTAAQNRRDRYKLLQY